VPAPPGRPLFLAVAALAVLLGACDKVLGIADNYVYCGPYDYGDCGGAGGGGTAGSSGAGGSTGDASPDAP
jgi:hypothetical protein